MKAYATQLHLHGSMSEGPASCMAHDHMAAETGHAEVIWWTDHDFRVANFGKLSRMGFSGLVEEVDHPNRSAEAAERLVKVPMTWKPVGGDPPVHGLAEAQGDLGYAGASGSLRIRLPAAPPGGQERVCLYELQMGAHYETFPLLTKPVVRLAVHAGAGVGTEGRVLVSFTLSEQPPDLVNTRLTYELGGEGRGAGGDVVERSEHGTGSATMSLPFAQGEWNEYTLDLARDVERLGLRGGLDNSLHRLRIGVASSGPEVTAHFGQLEVSVAHRGPEVLALHRQLLASLPTRVRHHVGLEVSYYGRHITGFGASVPIPDYEGLLPAGLTSEEVVAHIHRYGGLACLAHPSAVDPRGTAATLADRGMFGVDLMEVAHGPFLIDRLRLWDRLATHGRIVTGIGVSDAHSAKTGWTGSATRPVGWITRIWADSDEEKALLEGMRRGHVFFADPTSFRGEIELAGPGDAAMGDVLVVGTGGTAPEVQAKVTGLEPEDVIAWYCNGALVHASSAEEVTSGGYAGGWRAPVAVDRLLAVRVQVHRPRQAVGMFDGVIACSNPLYLAPEGPERPETGHRVVSAPAG